MAAIFGAIGAITAGELDEMGRRLAHRGGHANWTEVASGVYLGQVASTPLRPCIRGALAIVIDAPEGLAPSSTSLVLEAASAAWAGLSGFEAAALVSLS